MLLIEDAQYADAGLLDFLDHLIDWARDLPIYVLVFARPELDQARPGFRRGPQPQHADPGPAGPGVHGPAGRRAGAGDAAAARAKITRQAQGIPLFAVETVRSLIDRDVVQPVEGVYRLIGDVGELAVPDSLHALLAARLDALDPDARRAGRGRRRAGHHVPGRGADRGVRAGRADQSGHPGRPGAPRGAERIRRPAVAGARQLPVRPGDAAAGRLRHAVPPRPQGPPSGRGRAPARRVPRRRRRGRRGHRPALPGRAERRPRRSGRRRDPRAGRNRPDPGRRACRAHRRSGPGRDQLRRRRRAEPAGCGRRSSGRALGARCPGRSRRRRLCGGHRVRRACPWSVPPARSGPGRRAGSGARRPGPEHLGPSRGCPRAADRRRRRSCGNGPTPTPCRP